MTWNAADKHSAIIEKLDNFFMMLLLEFLFRLLCLCVSKQHEHQGHKITKVRRVSQCLPVQLYLLTYRLILKIGLGGVSIRLVEERVLFPFLRAPARLHAAKSGKNKMTMSILCSFQNFVLIPILIIPWSLVPSQNHELGFSFWLLTRPIS